MSRWPSTAAEPRRRELLLAALLGGMCIALVHIGVTGLTGNDSYYHLRMAERLPEWGYVQSFPWLQWTLFRDEFVSHHYGFHTLMAPLAWGSQKLLGDPVWGARLGLMLSMALSAALLCAVLRAIGVRHRLWWVLLLAAVPWHFWLRMAFWRAPMLGLPLLLMCTWCCLQPGEADPRKPGFDWRRPGLALLTAFAFAHVYGGVVLLPLIPGSFFVAALLTGAPLGPPAAVLGATLLGLAAGMVISPYFPANLEFMWVQLFVTGLGGAEDIGREWRSYDAWFLAGISAPLALIWGLSLVRRLTSERRADMNEIGLLILHAAFLALTLKSRRFVEYWPIFALLNAADMGRWLFARTAPVARPAGETPPLGSAEERINAGGVAARGPEPEVAIRSIALAVLAMVGIVTSAGVNLAVTGYELSKTEEHTELAAAMDWLKKNSAAGAVVFADDWDVFPFLFYHNQHNYYCTGLDPQFTAVRWPAMWERYKRITRGEAPATVPDKLAKRENLTAEQRAISLTDIRDWFRADYVYVDKDHGPFYRQLRGDGDNFTLVYPPDSDGRRQPPVALFEVRPQANP